MPGAAAPDDAVRGWRTRTGRPATEFGNRGQVTRPLRVRYLASEIGGTRELVVAQYESLTGLLSPLHGRLEGVARLDSRRDVGPQPAADGGRLLDVVVSENDALT